MADVNNLPAQKNWTAYAGDVSRAMLTAPSDGDPVDLTGATGWAAQIRKKASDPVVAATAVVTPTDLTMGEVTVEFDGEELRALLASAESFEGVWDVQYTAVGETLPTTMYRGKFTVIHDVTRVGTQRGGK